MDGESSIPVHFKNAVTNRGKYVHKRLKCKRLIQRLTNIKVAVFMFDGVITLEGEDQVKMSSLNTSQG